jgi:hypothetical protein
MLSAEFYYLICDVDLNSSFLFHGFDGFVALILLLKPARQDEQR